MSRDKSPGPNGVTVGFYQKNWELGSGDIIKGILYVLIIDCSVININHTKITLVPK